MELNKIIEMVVLAIYLLFMLSIGFGFMNKNNSLNDYFLGGRGLNKWVTAMSAQASDMSGWLLLGLPGTAYIVFGGTTEAIWTAIGLAIGTYLNWLFVAKRLRKQTEISNNSITIPVYFENRFEDKTHILRLASSIFIMFFFLIYTAAQFTAGAKLLEATFGVPYIAGLFLGAAIITGYTFTGGFSAVAWTDLIQGVIMFFAILFVPFIIINQLGGFDSTVIQFHGLEAAKNEVFSWIPRSAAGKVNALLLISSIGWGLGYFGQPHILSRFMAIKSSDEVKPARIIAMIWVIITLAAAVVIGVLGKLYFDGALAPQNYTDMVNADSEQVFMLLIQSIFGSSKNILSILVAGLLLTAILAAIMSTADSQLLVTASTFGEDIYHLLSKKKPSNKKLVSISRVAVVIIAIIAVVISLDRNSSVFDLVSMAWGGFGAAFGPCILFSLYYRKMTAPAAIAGVLTGGLVDIIWHYMSGGIFNVYELVPAFIISSVVIVIVSFFTKCPESVSAQYDKAQKAEI